MKQILIVNTKGDKEGTIDSLIDFLQAAKENGGTHYNMRWSNDPMWAFKWFEVYRIESDEELDKREYLQAKKIVDNYETYVGFPDKHV